MPETKNTVTKEKMLLMNSLVDWTQQRKGSMSTRMSQQKLPELTGKYWEK